MFSGCEGRAGVARERSPASSRISVIERMVCWPVAARSKAIRISGARSGSIATLAIWRSSIVSLTLR